MLPSGFSGFWHPAILAMVAQGAIPETAVQAVLEATVFRTTFVVAETREAPENRASRVQKGRSVITADLQAGSSSTASDS